MTTLNVPVQLRRGPQSSCPSVMLAGEVYVSLDTGLLFAGTGVGVIPVGGSGSTPSGAGNLVYATPNGSSGNASLRALVAADIPNLSSVYDVAGLAAAAYTSAKAYADSLASNYDAAGAAATAQTNAETFATSAVATETSRAETAEALLAPKASPTFTGTVSGITYGMVGADASGAAAAAQSAAESYAASLSTTIDGDGTVMSSSGVSLPLGGHGTLALVNATQNYVLAGPGSGSSAGAPTYRALVAADIPALSYDAAGAAATAQANAESFATSAVASETSRAETAEALLAPRANATFTGTFAIAAGALAIAALASDSLTVNGDGTVLSSSGPTITLGSSGALTLVSQAKNTVLAGPASTVFFA